MLALMTPALGYILSVELRVARLCNVYRGQVSVLALGPSMRRPEKPCGPMVQGFFLVRLLPPRDSSRR